MKFELPNLKVTYFELSESFDVQNAETEELYGPEDSFEDGESAAVYGNWLITELLKLQHGMWLLKCNIGIENPEFVDGELMKLHENWKRLSPACKADCEMCMNTYCSRNPEDYEIWRQLKSSYLEFVA